MTDHDDHSADDTSSGAMTLLATLPSLSPDGTTTSTTVALFRKVLAWVRRRLGPTPHGRPDVHSG